MSYKQTLAKGLGKMLLASYLFLPLELEFDVESHNSQLEAIHKVQQHGKLKKQWILAITDLLQQPESYGYFI